MEISVYVCMCTLWHYAYLRISLAFFISLDVITWAQTYFFYFFYFFALTLLAVLRKHTRFHYKNAVFNRIGRPR